MGFRTKIDYSDNRQINQTQNSSTVLPGKTQFGFDYEDRLIGPDLLSITTTIDINNIVSSFSGNSLSILFTFGSPYMDFAEELLLPYSGATGITQTVESVFTGFNPYELHGFTYYNNYSGVTFDITPVTFTDLGGGNYSGLTHTETLSLLSAPSLDYLGNNVFNIVRGISQIDFLETYSGVTFYNLEIDNSVDYLYGKHPVNGNVVEVELSSIGGSGASKPLKIITGTTYTLISEDKTKWLKFINTNPIEIFIPVGVFSDGDLIEGYQGDDGQIEFNDDVVTLTRPTGTVNFTRGNGCVFYIKYESSTSVHLFGDLEMSV